MPAPVVVAIGAAAFRVASKKVLDLLVKRGAKKLTQKQVDKLPSPPRNVTASNVANVLRQTRVAKPATPRANPGGPRPPASRANTRPAAPRKAPKPPAAPKRDNAPPVRSSSSSNQPRVQSSSPRQSSSGASYSRVRPNQRKPKDDSKIVGLSPAGRAVLGSAPLADSLPDVDTKSRPKKKAPARTAPSSMATPKKKTDDSPKTSLRPKKRPAAGPVTNESFGKAFARNRKAGNATFKWKDKKYTTRYKEETIKQHKKKFGVEGKY